MDPYDLNALATKHNSPWGDEDDYEQNQALWEKHETKVNTMVMQAMQAEDERLALINKASAMATANEVNRRSASLAAQEANYNAVAQEVNQAAASLAAQNAIEAAKTHTITQPNSKPNAMIVSETVTPDPERLKPSKKDLIKFVFEKLVAKKNKELDERRAIEKKMDAEIDLLKDEQKVFIKEIVKEEVGTLIDTINAMLKPKFPKTQLNLRFFQYQEKIDVTVYLEGGTSDQYVIPETEDYKQKTAELNRLIEKKQKQLKAYKEITQRISTLVYQHNPTVTTIIDAACASFSSAEIESLNNILIHLDEIIHKQWEPDFEEDTFFTEHPVEATLECEVVKPDKFATQSPTVNHKEYFYD